MNWRDEPVKIGDKFLTEKGGVVEVVRYWPCSQEWEMNGASGKGYWGRDFLPRVKSLYTDIHYGPIIDKIKETNVDSKRLDEIEAKANSILAEVAELRKPPIPELPTKPGTVIESGGVRLFLCEGDDWPWASTVERIGESTGYSHEVNTVMEFARQNGGFKVLLD